MAPGWLLLGRPGRPPHPGPSVGHVATSNQCVRSELPDTKRWENYTRARLVVQASVEHACNQPT
eukprot:8808081-Alexandrium_andersonii.AAC.1